MKIDFWEGRASRKKLTSITEVKCRFVNMISLISGWKGEKMTNKGTWYVEEEKGIGEKGKGGKKMQEC